MAGSKGHGGLVAGGVAVLAAPLAVIGLCVSVALYAVLGQQGSACTSGSTSWVQWAVDIAQDDSHGYSQPNRGGNPDYDCSSLVWFALKNAGIDIGPGPFSTVTEPDALERAGFTRHAFDRGELQAGDILWRDGHTEIYAGDGRYVGAHKDENGGIMGRTPGDQTGHEISVEKSSGDFTYYWRAPAGAGQAVSGSTSSGDGAIGLDERAAEAWFDGRQGPEGACATYAYGQCTWWACMRGYRLGWKHIGRFWGNGQDWAASAKGEGYETNTDAPVPGAFMSVPAGRLGSSPAYGHVLVVESVDTAKGTITTSEKGKGVRSYSRTLPIVNGGTYILPKDPIQGADDSSSCLAGDGDGEKADAAKAKDIAHRKVEKMGWDDSEYDCLVRLWDGESGWRWDAENPSSGAYGIPQALPGSKMSSSGQDWRTNAATQIDWGLKYIRDRYSTPCQAWNTWQSRSPHWY